MDFASGGTTTLSRGMSRVTYCNVMLMVDVSMVSHLKFPQIIKVTYVSFGYVNDENLY